MKIALSEVIKGVAEKSAISQEQAKEIVGNFLTEVKDNLVVGNDVPLSGIGVLRVADVKAKPEREGVVKPSTGEKGILPAVPAHKKVTFKCSAPLKAEIKEKTLA